jgi:hypothetical protein
MYNYQDGIKFMALITMIIDHFGLYLYPENSILRVIGRCSAPIFCFYLGYNLNIKKYKSQKILIYAIIIQFILQDYIYLNILFNMIVCQVIISKVRHHQILYILTLFTYFIFDYELYIQIEYGVIPLLFALSGYMIKRKYKYGILYLLSSYIVYSIDVNEFIELNYTLYVFLQSIVFLALLLNHKNKLNHKILCFSRYTLQIYCIQYIIFQVIYYELNELA